MDAFTAVDRALLSRYGVGLEDALCEGCLSGLPAILDEGVAIVRRCTHTQVNEDGGRSFTFEGLFVVMGLRYRFRCYIFADAGGQRFISDVASFEPAAWQVRLAM